MAGLEDLAFYNSSHRYLDYCCGYCGFDTHGLVLVGPRSEDMDRRWLMCPRCGGPSVIDADAVQWPAGLGGPEVIGMPEDVRVAYEEARRCLGVGAFTACELMCRKILMYLAVDVAEAKEGMKFVQYIDALEKAGYVTPPMKPWVKLIKDRGNEATHELPHVDEDRALSTLEFTGRLLALSYEMTHMTGEFTEGADTDA